MIAIENFKIFFENHPELAHLQMQIMATVEKEYAKDGIILGGVIEEILGDELSEKFFSEINSPVHKEIDLKAIREAYKNLEVT
ncbi:MAG: hypothetical protein KJI71_03185 [Patescibacteria group bacterium]|nr:hypothetical protein [Patescibacteria group bacterium]